MTREIMARRMIGARALSPLAVQESIKREMKRRENYVEARTIGRLAERPSALRLFSTIANRTRNLGTTGANTTQERTKMRWHSSSRLSSGPRGVSARRVPRRCASQLNSD